jgi:hypothetical protein
VPRHRRRRRSHAYGACYVLLCRHSALQLGLMDSRSIIRWHSLKLNVAQRIARTWRTAFIGAVSTLLASCGTDPSAASRSEAASVRALGHSGGNLESIRLALSQRGYRCIDGSGQILAESGSITPPTQHVYCVKNVGSDLACLYRVRVMLVPQESQPAIHVHSDSTCL